MDIFWQRRTVFLGLLIAVSQVLATPAYAQEQDVAVENIYELSFSQLVDRARSFYENGEYDNSIKYLVLANRKEPNALLLLNIARGHGQTGDCVQSLVYYRAFVNDPNARADAVQVAQRHLDNADQCADYSNDLAGRLMLDAQPLEANVYLNDVLVGTTPYEVGGLPPGEHALRIEKEGYESHEQMIILTTAEDASFDVTLKKETVVTPEVVESDVKQLPTLSPASPNYGAYSLIALGAGAITVGLVHSLAILPNTSEEQLSASQSENDILIQRLNNRYDSQKTVATTAYISGSALLVGGGLWLWMDAMDNSPSRPKVATTKSWRIMPSVGESHTGLFFLSSF